MCVDLQQPWLWGAGSCQGYCAVTKAALPAGYLLSLPQLQRNSCCGTMPGVETGVRAQWMPWQAPTTYLACGATCNMCHHPLW